MKRGPKPGIRATGKFQTTAELIDRVWTAYETTNMSVMQVAALCNVSEPTVGKILKSRPDHFKGMQHEFRRIGTKNVMINIMEKRSMNATKTYKDHKYKVIFCDPSADWKAHAGMFHIELAMGNDEYFETYAAAELKAKEIIDIFVASVPQTSQAWLAAMDDCMVWDGYEECHLDEAMVLALLSKASRFYQTDKEKS